MNRKPKGWRNESTRHALAARGIGTKKMFRFYPGVTYDTAEYNIRCPAHPWEIFEEEMAEFGYEPDRDYHWEGEGRNRIVIDSEKMLKDEVAMKKLNHILKQKVDW